VADDDAEPAPEPVAEEVTEPAAEEVTEPAAEAVADDDAEPAPEPVADEVAEPVATEPVAEDQTSDVEPEQPTVDQPEHVALNEPLAVTYTSSVTVLAGLEELGFESQIITNVMASYHRSGAEPGEASEPTVAEATTEHLVCPTVETTAEQQPVAEDEDAPEPIGPEASPDDVAEPLAIAPETADEPASVEAVPLESLPEPLPVGSEEMTATEQSPALTVVGGEEPADPANTDDLHITEEATSSNDLVIGGPGADMLYGGEGDDLLFGDDLDSDLLSDLVSAWTLGRSQLIS
jgi:hypothetical protein